MKHLWPVIITSYIYRHTSHHYKEHITQRLRKAHSLLGSQLAAVAHQLSLLLMCRSFLQVAAANFHVVLRPTVIDRRSSIDDRRSSTYDGRSSTDDSRPTTVDRRSSTYDWRSSTDDRRPMIVDRRPTTDDRRPIISLFCCHDASMQDSDSNI